jgi:hypothetical protein
MNFDSFYKKTLCLGKTAITFSYEVGLKSFLYEKLSTQKVTSKKVYCLLFRESDIRDPPVSNVLNL